MRKIYFFMMAVVPSVMIFFFLNLMNEGLPLKVPSAVVDHDRSSMSRQTIRQLNAMELIDITEDLESYDKAMEKIRSGEIFGFFMIPENFQKDAIAGRTPTLTYYCNMTIFVPGTLTFKGFKTIAVSTAGSIVRTELVSAGVGDYLASPLLQPLVVQDRPLNNPWTNYNIYLSNSFLPCLLALLIMTVTAFSICQEQKQGTSVEWLRTAGGNMAVALAGKLLPQTVVFSAVGVALQAIMFRYLDFPLNNHPLHIITAMVLMVMACQAFAVCIVEIVPNLRMALSICSLFGILCFSVAGFSFPVEQMYGAVGIFSYCFPIRYYFLIYIDQALNGIPIYYSRFYYVALLVFLLLPVIGLRRLRHRMLNPVYVP
ncbi:MAG: ABC transporter permease [Lachnoclostridium sp.]|nr:ABC transporter permease [Lachnoclostridium sp.]